MDYNSPLFDVIMTFYFIMLLSYTVTKAKRDAGPKHMGDGK
jgi:hypothetical protein